jgi:hypothetical protein
MRKGNAKSSVDVIMRKNVNNVKKSVDERSADKNSAIGVDETKSGKRNANVKLSADAKSASSIGADETKSGKRSANVKWSADTRRGKRSASVKRSADTRSGKRSASVKLSADTKNVKRSANERMSVTDGHRHHTDARKQFNTNTYPIRNAC